MLKPTLNDFKTLAAKYNRIVVYREIAGDAITPITLLMSFSDEKYLFLLESANLDKSFSRFTFFGFKPNRVIKYKNKKLIVESSEHGIEYPDANPIEYVMDSLKNESCHKEKALGDFSGGYVGFVGYDMANYMHILRSEIREDTENLSMGLFQIDEYYVFDNLMKKMYAACSVVHGGDIERSYRDAEKRTLEMAAEILSAHQRVQFTENNMKQRQDFSKEEFETAVAAVREQITGGEGVQIVISNKFEIDCSVNPVNLYRVLRNINPSPYMFYMKFNDSILCGTSPEVHLKISDNVALLKPLAGTYKYDETNLEQVKRDLLNDEKERAEHLMLLDLARNDLNTGCKSGTVKVLESFVPEVYSHVVHIVSEVQGELRDDVPPLKLFCNTFPAGTVSGAPKVRAMEIIDEYEKSPRGFYAGCAGYFSYSQDIDTCIVIRSALVKKDSVTLRAGAGIVHDSVPEKEYYESQNKLGALFSALTKINNLETKNVFND
jgi:anthranilate synthase component I